MPSQMLPAFSPPGVAMPGPMFNPYLQPPQATNIPPELLHQWNAFMQNQARPPPPPAAAVPTVVTGAVPKPRAPVPHINVNNISVGPSAAPEVYQMSETGDAMSTVESVILEGGTLTSMTSQSAPPEGQADQGSSSSSDPGVVVDNEEI